MGWDGWEVMPAGPSPLEARHPPEPRQRGHAAAAVPSPGGVATVVSVSVLQRGPFLQLRQPRSCFAALWPLTVLMIPRALLAVVVGPQRPV